MNQKALVLQELKENGSTTSWDLICKHRITRASEYIRQLRREDGYAITSVTESKDGKHWTRYFLTT